MNSVWIRLWGLSLLEIKCGMWANDRGPQNHTLVFDNNLKWMISATIDRAKCNQYCWRNYRQFNNESNVEKIVACNSLNTFRWILYCFCSFAEGRTPPGGERFFDDAYYTRVSSCVCVEFICILKSNVFYLVYRPWPRPCSKPHWGSSRALFCPSDEMSIQISSDSNWLLVFVSSSSRHTCFVDSIISSSSTIQFVCKVVAEWNPNHA